MNLRSEQMEVLHELELSPYVAELGATLRSRFPDLLGALPSEAMDARVVGGMRRAFGYGLVGFSDVARYLNLEVIYGPSLERGEPWMRRMLRDASVGSPRRRLDRLVAACVQWLRMQEASATARHSYGGRQ
ncbi:MAG: hypothetical protein AAF799_16410 [Myxococcota bacterium]